jgi:hypothetical protein
MEPILKKQVVMQQSIFLRNAGGGQFEYSELPIEVQISSLNAL